MDKKRDLLPFAAGDQLIRRQWHNGAWYFSVVDVVGLLTDSLDPGAYWRKVKQRLREDEGARNRDKLSRVAHASARRKAPPDRCG